MHTAEEKRWRDKFLGPDSPSGWNEKTGTKMLDSECRWAGRGLTRQTEGKRSAKEKLWVFLNGQTPKREPRAGSSTEKEGSDPGVRKFKLWDWACFFFI